MRRALILAGLAAVPAAIFAACSLDLDESLIDSGDGGPDVSVGGSGGSGASGGLAGSSGFGGSGGLGGTGGKEAGPACDADPQCETDAGCIEGKCTGGQCDFAVCPVGNACEARSCNVSTGTCSAPQSFGFKPSPIELEQDVGCGGAPQRCVAAFGDYVFVATADGNLHAWRVLNPATPEKLTIDAPTFPVFRMAASQDRVLLLSTVASGKLQLAWIDLPSNPLATTLTLTTVGVNFPGTQGPAYPGQGGDFLLVDNNPAGFFPAAYLPLPVQNNATVTQYPSTGIAPGANIVASSGTRLVGFRIDGSSTPVVPKLSLVSQAGTASAQSGTEADQSFETPTDVGAHYFASGFDGSVLWSTNKVYRDDAGTPLSTTVVLRWPLTPGATTFDASAEVELASSYSEDDYNSIRRGPVALIDANTALVTLALPSDPTAQTLVRSVTRSGSTLMLGPGNAMLPFTVGQIGIAASRKFGFVLTPQSTTPALKTTLHLFAPSCG